MNYNQKLRERLLGRRLRADAMPERHYGRPMLSLWGEDAGMTGSDVHSNRAYRIYLDYDETRTILSVDIVIEGELISPCSGYFHEELDEFDYAPILNWCLQHLERDTDL